MTLRLPNPAASAALSLDNFTQAAYVNTYLLLEGYLHFPEIADNCLDRVPPSCYLQFPKSVDNNASMMRPIPLNLMTLYADLLQGVDGTLDELPGSIATKTVKRKKYLYHTTKDGSARVERYLGPANQAEVQERAKAIKAAAERAKQRRSTITALKNSRIAAPTLVQGRILEVIANAGLFERGMTLVGTVAYQTYPCLIGAHLPASAFATNDIDLSVAEFVAADEEEDIESILKRADPTFSPVWHEDDKLPRKFQSKNFEVDILTSHRRGHKSPIPIDPLGCAAEALSFQEYPAEETIDAIALYGSGVVVRVPVPVRFAVHKLLVAQRRSKNMLGKRQKDLHQAEELIDIFLETDEASLQDALARTIHRASSTVAICNQASGVGRVDGSCFGNAW